MPSWRLSSFILVLAILGCGGAEPTPQAAAPMPVSSAPPAEPVHAPEFAAGVKAFEAGDYAGARTAFEAAAKGNPSDHHALWNLAQACEKLGDVAAAGAAYKAELVIKPDSEKASAALANLYSVGGHPDDALAIATHALASHPGSSLLHAAMGQALATRGDQDSAMQQFEQAIKGNPDDPMLHFAFAIWLNKWHVRGAAAHLDLALAALKDDYAMSVSIGHEYRMAGEFDSCVKTFGTAIKTTDSGEVRTERALCKLGLKDEVGATADLEAAVATDPAYAQGHFFLAGRFAVAKRFIEAVAEYQAYLQLAPTGSLADQANERLKMADDAATHDKGAVAPKKKPGAKPEKAPRPPGSGAP